MLADGDSRFAGVWDYTGAVHSNNLNYNMNSDQLGAYLKSQEDDGMKLELLVTYTLGTGMYFAAYMSDRPGNTRCERASLNNLSMLL